MGKPTRRLIKLLSFRHAQNPVRSRVLVLLRARSKAHRDQRQRRRQILWSSIGDMPELHIIFRVAQSKHASPTARNSQIRRRNKTIECLDSKVRYETVSITAHAVCPHQYQLIRNASRQTLRDQQGIGQEKAFRKTSHQTRRRRKYSSHSNHKESRKHDHERQSNLELRKRTTMMKRAS